MSLSESWGTCHNACHGAHERRQADPQRPMPCIGSLHVIHVMSCRMHAHLAQHIYCLSNA
jgi:hypothetical protein